jgi:hypothetical protein
MNPSSSLTLAPDGLRDRVLEVVRRHWVAPRVLDLPAFIPPAQVDELSRAALDTMLTRQFRVGPLPPPEIYDQLLKRVRRRVQAGRRIRVSIGYSPLKNPNSVAHSRADWAEFFALCHLVAWHNKVQAVYPPGLEIQIVFDDSTLSMANKADPARMKSYMNSIPELIRALHFESLFLPTMRQSSFAWLLNFGFYQLAGWRVRRWERDPANRDRLEKMNDAARRNVAVPPGLSLEDQDRFVLRASHRYRVYWEALQLSGFSQTTGRMVAMYLDGTQHHIRQSVALHMTTLDKGQVTQPWQGVGALLDNGHGKLEPFVLTAGRRLRHQTQVIEDLNLIPLPGFERIEIATLKNEEASGVVS